MQRRHCEEGSRLYDLYQGRSVDLEAASVEKRVAMSVADHARWLEVARRVEDLQADHDDARFAYIDHVASCSGCEWVSLADAHPETTNFSSSARRPERVFGDYV
jgi:hypothetical protein